MSEQNKFDRRLEKYPHGHHAFFSRPHLTRRRFFQVAGTGVSGAFLAQRLAGSADGSGAGVATKNTAKNAIFILLAGAPSQTDTFDFKSGNGAPKSFAPATMNGALWPMGLLPKLGGQLSDFAIVRSMRAHALAHALSQTWTQIGRNPLGALGNIAPNIGSVVAIEKDQERLPTQAFPTFVALNSNGAAGSGYLKAKYGPFKVTPATDGIFDVENPAGQARFTSRWNLMNSLDEGLRVNSPNGVPMEDFGEFYSAALGLTFNPIVNQAFGFTAADSGRYGNSSLGDACLVASQVLNAQQGTRFVQITSNDGWDMHNNIYSPNFLPAKGAILDNAVSALLSDLKANGMLASTLVVMLGEFGRTVGPIVTTGRDHYLQHFAFFAGGGVKGGRIIGSTNATGSDVSDFGWSRQRYVYMEDVEATIYSALGIDWTYVRQDDPLHRGFEYVPFSEEDLYGPVDELWG